METHEPQSYSAFDGHRLFARGELEKVVLAVRKRGRAKEASRILVFNDATGKAMDFDLSGTEKDVLHRLRAFRGDRVPASAAASSGPGRPRLGVTAREVSLLPRHWE